MSLFAEPRTNRTPMSVGSAHRLTRARTGGPVRALAVVLGIGVGIGATTPSGRADVVYTATPGMIVVGGMPALLDLNGDGTTDLTIERFSGGFFDYAIGALTGANAGVAVEPDSSYATAVALSQVIGPELAFATISTLTDCSEGGSSCQGEWSGGDGGDGTDAYLGAMIISATGETHYGWVHVVIGKGAISAEVIGYAYETAPDTAICAGLSPDPCGTISLGDLNDDGIVDGADLGLLLNNWGGDGVGDLNEDGIVDGADLGLLLSNWG